jgi:hypothetical protein
VDDPQPAMIKIRIVEIKIAVVEKNLLLFILAPIFNIYLIILKKLLYKL